MATFEVTDPQTGRKIRLTGDSPPTEAELTEIFASLPPAQQPDFPGAAIIEPARAVISGAGRAIGGGLAGLAQAVSPFAEPGAGAETVQQIQAGAFQPETEAGQRGLQTLGDLVQKGIDIVNIPISGIGGILELVSGQGIDQAVETIKAIQGQGVSKTFGERVFEETGSPLAATAAETAPAAALEVLGLKGAGAAISATGRAGRAVAPTIEAAFKVQSPTKQRIARLIEGGSTDVETARFKLDAPAQTAGTSTPDVQIIGAAGQDIPGLPAPLQAAGAATGDIPKPPVPPQTKLQEFLNIGGPRVKTDRTAINAIDQGFDEGVIAAVKGANPEDRTKMLKMVDIMERGKANKLFAAKNRPSDIAGDSLMDRFRSVVSANKKAGSELEGVSKSLKGQQVDFDPAVDAFIDDLDSIGVSINRDLTPNFKGSDIEDLAGPESAIRRVMKRLSGTKPPDAFELHRMKRFIDEQVTFGKSAEGLAGRTVFILKSLRRNLDGILDQNFPEYNRVNTVFSETIGAIDALQDVAGRKMNLTGPNADKATGVLLRRLMSNAQSRVRLLDSVDQIEAVAKKHGGVFKDDLLTQVLFVDELDSVFGPVARTSFQGQIDQALKRGVGAVTTKAGAIGVGLEAIGKVAEKVRGIDEKGAFKAIKELLGRP